MKWRFSDFFPFFHGDFFDPVVSGKDYDTEGRSYFFRFFSRLFVHGDRFETALDPVAGGKIRRA